MIEFGASLRAAREAKGLTVSQLVEITHIPPSTINELESENFERIAAPIYGRGFVKLYCEAVGLAPKPFIDEFMAIYNGEHEPTIRERPMTVSSEPTPTATHEETPSPAEPPAVPAVESPIAAEESAPNAVPSSPVQPSDPPAPQPSRPADDLDLFGMPMNPAEDRPASQPNPAFASAKPHTGLDGREDTPPAFDESPSLSRYAAPIRQSIASASSAMPWRLILLGAVGIVLLIGLLTGIRALYRATAESTPVVKAQTAQPAATTKPKAPNKPAAKPAANTDRRRTPQKVPSLYID